MKGRWVCAHALQGFTLEELGVPRLPPACLVERWDTCGHRSMLLCVLQSAYFETPVGRPEQTVSALVGGCGSPSWWWGQHSGRCGGFHLTANSKERCSPQKIDMISGFYFVLYLATMPVNLAKMSRSMWREAKGSWVGLSDAMGAPPGTSETLLHVPCCCARQRVPTPPESNNTQA